MCRPLDLHGPRKVTHGIQLIDSNASDSVEKLFLILAFLAGSVFPLIWKVVGYDWSKVRRASGSILRV